MPTKRSATTTAPSAIVVYQRKKQKQMNKEEEAQEELEFLKLVVKQMLVENPESTKLQEIAKGFMIRPSSPNTSQNKTLPRNPPDSKILKWKSDQKTHVLTLLKSSGEVKHITREDALGLGVADLQELLELQLCRDEDDEDSMNFELQFKGQIRDKDLE
ncbi:hypothetical protein Hanom_Chr14g01265441 [Helianthus anomalus]